MNILTSNGFKEFDGIKDQGISETLLLITFESGNSIKCTNDHLFAYEEDFLPALFLEQGDIISGETVSFVEKVENERVYDALNVDGGNHYTTNGIESHNCNLLFLDEFAFVNNATEFYTSTYPVI